MKQELYQQCLMSQGNRVMVTWIPVEGAKLGSTMVLYDQDTKEPLDGRWETIAVYEGTKSIEEAKIDARRYDKWRDTVDV